MKNNSKANPNKPSILRYYEFCTVLHDKKFKPLPKYKIYKDWMKKYKEKEIKFLKIKEDAKIYDY